MNKHNLLKRIASVATELDQSGFTKEANSKVTAPGVWSLQDAFTYAKAGTWGG